MSSMAAGPADAGTMGSRALARHTSTTALTQGSSAASSSSSSSLASLTAASTTSTQHSTLKRGSKYAGASTSAVNAANSSKGSTTTGSAETPTSDTSSVVLRSTDFESMSLGGVQPSQFNAALGGTNGKAFYYDDMSVVNDPEKGNVLRTTLDAGTINGIPAGANNGGVFFMALPKQVDNACISYDLRFSGDFDFSLGGKLPGLEGVAPGVSPSAPTGGHPTSEGWSGRLMWLGPKAYRWAGPSNMAVSYMYHPGQSSQYGDNVRWNTAFQGGKWTTVKTCYTMNTVGRADGVLQSWVDGQQVIDDTSFVYRTDADVHVSHINWSIFRGGNTISWAGSRTGTVDIDNLTVTTEG